MCSARSTRWAVPPCDEPLSSSQPIAGRRRGRTFGAPNAQALATPPRSSAAEVGRVIRLPHRTFLDLTHSMTQPNDTQDSMHDSTTTGADIGTIAESDGQFRSLGLDADARRGCLARSATRSRPHPARGDSAAPRRPRRARPGGDRHRQDRGVRAAAAAPHRRRAMPTPRDRPRR